MLSAREDQHPRELKALVLEALPIPKVPARTRKMDWLARQYVERAEAARDWPPSRSNLS